MHSHEAHEKTADDILGGFNIKPPHGSNTPPTATMLVSLFLILITFFMIINSHAAFDQEKKNAVLKSVNEKFGKPEETDAIKFGVVTPNLGAITDKTIEIFGDNAKVETTINNEYIKISFATDYLFYDDESEIKPELRKLITALRNTIAEENKGADARYLLLAGSGNFPLGRARLESFRKRLALSPAEIGISQKEPKNFSMVIEYE